MWWLKQNPLHLVAPLMLIVLHSAVTVHSVPLHSSSWEQTTAVTELAKRLLGDDAGRFQFAVQSDQWLPKHTATLVNSGQNQLSITGNSGVAVAWALHYYITQYCQGMVTWSGHRVQLPSDKLPSLPGGRINLVANDNYTAMPNVCTFSYSYAWWSFDDWQKQIDWMALHGVNLAYALTGQEQVFRNVFMQNGLSNADLDEYFAGPAFLAWNRMGNLKRWGGPLPSSWYQQQVELQQQILKQMLSLGIQPVLQGFSGMVPDAFIKKFPNVNFTRLSDWNGFGSNYSQTYVLDPEDPLFVNISMQVINENIKIFGDVTDYFAMDTFNENQPASGDLKFISSISSAIFRGLKQAKPTGIWVLQSWFFGNDGGFWTLERVKAFLEPIPTTHLLIFDLYGDSRGSLAPSLEGYFNHSFVWQQLHNYGGNNAMFGGLEWLNNEGPWELRRRYPNSMAGVGIAPEGIMQNEVMYEFSMEFNWRRDPVFVPYWVQQFARRRYGDIDDRLVTAWQLLQTSLYNGQNAVVASPALIHRPSLGLNEAVYYNTSTVEAAWRLLLMVNGTGNLLLSYDQVDLTRQMLQIRFYQYYQHLCSVAQQQDADGVKSTGNTLLNLLSSMDRILATDSHYLLQGVIESARAFGTNADEQNLYEFNVRNQLTAWGPGPYNIGDYAGKMYNGLINKFYLPRWQMFVDELASAVESKQAFDQNKFVQDVFSKVEKPFYLSTDSTGPSKPTGDAYSTALSIQQSLPPAPQFHHQQQQQQQQRQQQRGDDVVEFEFLEKLEELDGLNELIL